MRNRTPTALIAALLGALIFGAPGFAFAQAAPDSSERQVSAPDDNAAPADGRRIVYLPPMLAELFAPLPPLPLDGRDADDPLQTADEPAGGEATRDGGASAGPGAGGTPPRLNASPSVSPRAVAGDFVPDEVLVTIAGDGQTAQEIATVFGLEVRAQRLSGLLGASVVRFGIPDGRTVGFVLAQLAGDIRVLRRVPNHIFTLQQAAGIVNYAFERIALDAGTASGDGIAVGVIDTALDAGHPALAGVVAATFDALPDRVVKARDHGTSIAGLIAGVGPFRGMAPGARLFHARAFEDGLSNTDALIAALDWAVGEGARIVNMSFVGPRNALFKAACDNAEARGVVLVAAAGNNGPKAPYGYPAAYDSVIAVTATDVHDRLMKQANRGPYVFVSAPGVNVIAPIPGGTDIVTGTSFAAAIATGAVANLMRRGIDLEPRRMGELLAETAIDLGPAGRDGDFGFGLVNARAALAHR